ncbi:MAG TPA: hypothetical protein VNT32_05100, partial [Thermoleophilaceae bacterium]|nr:hypothetical protein [Thermoleophilaceae bacterium]
EEIDERDREQQEAELLRLLDEDAAPAIISGFVQGLGLLLLAVPLVYLFRAVRLRRERIPMVGLVLAVIAPVGYAIVAAARQFALVSAAGDFVGGSAVPGETAADRAEDVIRDSAVSVIGGISLGLGLALGFAVILISMNAMRAGLTSRFLGVIGIIVGALYILPVAGGPQIVQLFWLGALGLLLLDRWPGGRGPAWETGQAEPWPTAADQRAMVEAMKEAAAPPDKGGDDAAEDEPPRPASRKRKGKSRRRR